MSQITFTSSLPYCDRRHYLTEDDVRILLGRLPPETYYRLRAVHFNDRSEGVRLLGYVNWGHREIAICALPPRVSLTRFLVQRQSPSQFGAKKNCQWPTLAVRRFLLYDVFLHELGHLQIVRKNTDNKRKKFALEKLAQEFADYWRQELWATYFNHPDPVHNAPDMEEKLHVQEPFKISSTVQALE